MNCFLAHCVHVVCVCAVKHVSCWLTSFTLSRTKKTPVVIRLTSSWYIQTASDRSCCESRTCSKRCVSYHDCRKLSVSTKRHQLSMCALMSRFVRVTYWNCIVVFCCWFYSERMLHVTALIKWISSILCRLLATVISVIWQSDLQQKLEFFFCCTLRSYVNVVYLVTVENFISLMLCHESYLCYKLSLEWKYVADSFTVAT